MSRIFLLIVFLTITNFLFAQQNEEFKRVKNYFDYQRFMLNNEFRKKFESENNSTEKLKIKEDFNEFIQKIDSIQNTALIGALIKTKNREDLSHFGFQSASRQEKESSQKSELSKEANYPGGFENLRGQVADLFYTEAVLGNGKPLETSIAFVVERDGSISSVHAEGENFTFNRQAEIAMYLLPEKFDPAFINGMAVRYRFRLPLAMNFE